MFIIIHSAKVAQVTDCVIYLKDDKIVKEKRKR